VSWCYISDGSVFRFSMSRNRPCSQNILLLRVRLILAGFCRTGILKVFLEITSSGSKFLLLNNYIHKLSMTYSISNA